MSRHVFLSYSHQDGDFAELLQAKLSNDDFEFWIDIAELRAGETWRTKIDQAIHDSFALVLIRTPASEESVYVTYEWERALELGIAVIPVLLKPVENNHPLLDSLQYLDFTEHNKRPWEQLAEDLTVKFGEKDNSFVLVPRNVPHNVKELFIALNNWNPDTRLNALNALIQVGGEYTLPALLNMLERDPDIRVKRLAVSGLGWLGDEATVPVLLSTLEYVQDLGFAMETVTALGRIGSATAVPHLINRISSSKEYVLNEAMFLSLGQIGSEESIQFLFESLQHYDETKRNAAFKALRLIQVDTLIPNLIKVSKTAVDPDARRLALSLLDSAPSDIIAPILIDIFQNDDDRKVKTVAARLLGDLQVESAVPVLLRGIEDTTDTSLHSFISGALLSIKSQSALPGLVAIITQSSNSEARRVAATFLGRYGSKEEIPTLLKVFQNDSDPIVRSAALGAINAVDPDAALPVLIELLQSEENLNPSEQAIHIRRNAITWLSSSGNKAAVPVLINVLKDSKDKLSRRSAISSLAKINDKSEGIAFLFEVLRGDQDSELRVAAYHALKRIGYNPEQ